MTTLTKQKMQPTESNEIALLFSGGIDSSVAAAMLAEQYDRVHLLTFRNGFGHWGFRRVRKRVEELKAQHPGRIVFHEGSTKALFREVTVDTVLQDRKEFGGNFIWCMGCKLSMHTTAIKYCKEHGIPAVADGSSGDTQEMVEQSLVSISMTTHLYEDHGIRFETPVYDMTRDEKRAWLTARGYRLGLQIGDRHLGVQPTCHAGELAYLSYVLFNKQVKNDERSVTAFVEAKRPILDRAIADSE